MQHKLKEDIKEDNKEDIYKLVTLVRRNNTVNTPERFVLKKKKITYKDKKRKWFYMAKCQIKLIIQSKVT